MHARHSSSWARYLPMHSVIRYFAIADAYGARLSAAIRQQPGSAYARASVKHVIEDHGERLGIEAEGRDASVAHNPNTLSTEGVAKPTDMSPCRQDCNAGAWNRYAIPIRRENL